MADASFAPGPPVSELCGFKLPTFLPSIEFTLPPIKFPPPLPDFSVSLGLNCSANNPIDISGNLPWGGGRVATSDPDIDEQLDAATS